MVCHLFGAKGYTIIWINIGILLIGQLGTNFSEMYQNTAIFIQESAIKYFVAALMC